MPQFLRIALDTLKWKILKKKISYGPNGLQNSLYKVTKSDPLEKVNKEESN